MSITEILTDVVGLWLPGVGLGAGLCVMAFMIGYAISSLYNMIKQA